MVYLTSFTLFSGDIKKKKTLKMTSQLVTFRAFLFIFFRPPDPKSDKKIPLIH